jgi:hypothetical protein
MDAALLITESVINQGMSALISEITADEAYALVHEGQHQAAARVGTVVVTGHANGIDTHDHEGIEEAMICFAGILADAIERGAAIVVTSGDEATMRARAASADDDFRTLILTRVATGSMEAATGNALLMRNALQNALRGAMGN